MERQMKKSAGTSTAPMNSKSTDTMNQKIRVNPLDVIIWNGRHSGKDIVNIYTKFSPLMQIGADTKMLNFGLWKNSVTLPDAQKEMSEYVADFGDFKSAEKILDVGSGFCIPATIWKEKFPHLDIYCMDLNFSELNNGNNHIITQVNSSSNNIPFGDKSFDRIIALESAQHFVPLEKFFEESKRTLADKGELILAIPVTENSTTITLKLGILNITWLSKKYTKNHVHSVIKDAGFSLKNEESVGDL